MDSQFGCSRLGPVTSSIGKWLPILIYTNIVQQHYFALNEFG